MIPIVRRNERQLAVYIAIDPYVVYLVNFKRPFTAELACPGSNWQLEIFAALESCRGGCPPCF